MTEQDYKTEMLGVANKVRGAYQDSERRNLILGGAMFDLLRSFKGSDGKIKVEYTDSDAVKLAGSYEQIMRQMASAEGATSDRAQLAWMYFFMGVDPTTIRKQFLANKDDLLQAGLQIAARATQAEKQRMARIIAQPYLETLEIAQRYGRALAEALGISEHVRPVLGQEDIVDILERFAEKRSRNGKVQLTLDDLANAPYIRNVN